MDVEYTLQSGLEDLQRDLKGFIETRYQVLREELSVSVKKVTSTAAIFAAAAVCGLIGLLLLSICSALAVAYAFGTFQNQAGLIWGFLVIGGGAVILAGIFAASARAKLKAQDLAPKRTLRILKHDQEAFTNQGGEQNGEHTAARRQA